MAGKTSGMFTGVMCSNIAAHGAFGRCFSNTVSRLAVCLPVQNPASALVAAFDASLN